MSYQVHMGLVYWVVTRVGDYVPQTAGVLLFFKYSDIVVSEPTEEGGTAD